MTRKRKPPPPGRLSRAESKLGEAIRSRGLSYEQAAAEIRAIAAKRGITGGDRIGHASLGNIARGHVPSRGVARAIEAWSRGAVSAADLLLPPGA